MQRTFCTSGSLARDLHMGITSVSGSAACQQARRLEFLGNMLAEHLIRGLLPRSDRFHPQRPLSFQRFLVHVSSVAFAIGLPLPKRHSEPTGSVQLVLLRRAWGVATIGETRNPVSEILDRNFRRNCILGLDRLRIPIRQGRSCEEHWSQL